jgi:hypothetical protein
MDVAVVRPRQIRGPHRACLKFSARAFTIGRAFYRPKIQHDRSSLAVIRGLSKPIDDLDSFRALGIYSRSESESASEIQAQRQHPADHARFRFAPEQQRGDARIRRKASARKDALSL